MVQKVLGLCAVPLGTEIDEPLQVRKVENVESNPRTRRRKGAKLKEKVGS